jgi:hypothetical protein
VIPVLVSGAALPRPEQLPDDLKPLLSRQKYELRFERFSADVDHLVAQLRDIVPPKGRRNRRLVLLAAAVAVIAALVFVAIKDRRPKSVVNEARLVEATKRCQEIAEITGTLSSVSDRKAWAEARERFWFLYNGPLYQIELWEREKTPDQQSSLEGAMVEFGRLLRQGAEMPDKIPPTNLNQAALSVNRACNKTLQSM